MNDPHDWEADPRPYNECQRDWRLRHGWTWQETADQLCEPLETTRRHAKPGRAPADTRKNRRLMTLIDLERGKFRI